MKVLVLGGNGFIGQTIVSALAQTPDFTPLSAARRPGADRSCDATDLASLQAACADTGAIVNAAAGRPEAMRRATENLCAVAATSRQHIVHLSSMAVYGAASGLVREDAAVDAAGSAYAASKIACEANLLRFAADGGRATILRPGIVYGPGDQQWTGRLCRLLQAGRLGDLGAAGDGICNLVHVRDVAAAAVACLRAPGGTFNLGARTPPRWNEMFGQLAAAVGAVPLRRIGPRRLQAERALAFPLQLAKRAAGPAARRLPEPMPPSLLALFARHIRLDPTRADALGFARTDDSAGLAEAGAWFAAQA